MPEENLPLPTLLNPGQAIAKSTGQLMMALYQARVKAVSGQAPALGVVAANEPKQLFFKLDNLSALLTALTSPTGSGYFAACLGLTVLDSQGNPTTPTTEQLELMQELVDLQAQGNYEDYELKIKDINLAQTILIAGCDSNGNLEVNETGVFSFYDMAGQCCTQNSTGG